MEAGAHPDKGQKRMRQNVPVSAHLCSETQKTENYHVIFERLLKGNVELPND